MRRAVGLLSMDGSRSSTAPPVSDAYSTLTYTWTASPSQHFIVRATSDMDWVGSADVNSSGTAYSVELSCLVNRTYHLQVLHMQAARSVHAKLPQSAMLPLSAAERPVALRAGLWGRGGKYRAGEPLLPATRFALFDSSAYKNTMPEQFMDVVRTKTAQCRPTPPADGASSNAMASSRELLIGAEQQGSWQLTQAALDDSYVPYMDARTVHEFSTALLSHGARGSRPRPASHSQCAGSDKWSSIAFPRWHPAAHDSGADVVNQLLRARRRSSQDRSRETPPPLAATQPRIHIVGDSLSSGLFVSMVVATSSCAAAWPLWRAAALTEKYYCTDLEPLRARTQWARLSWMFWTAHGGVPGCFTTRSDGVILSELGLNASDPAPDLLLLESGLWDVEDTEPDSLLQEVPSLIRMLRERLPHTFIIWLGPLQVNQVSKTWRTASRLQSHTRALRSALEGLRVPLIDGRTMFTAINNTIDGRHYRLTDYWSWASVALQVWREHDRRAGGAFTFGDEQEVAAQP